MKILGLFPGQGSQAVGMAKNWYDTSDFAKQTFKAADDVLGFSLSKLCFEGPIEDLTLTQNAQPALLTAAYISYALSDIHIDVAAGHSLGEYTALLASGVFSFEEAVLLVHKRGTYMQQAVPVGTGAMLAVMGMETEALQNILDQNSHLLVEIANINSPGQIVLAGKKEDIGIITELLGKEGAKTIPLNVSAPFHCSLMKPAAELLTKDLDAITFNEPKIPVYSNYTTKRIMSGEEARQCLKDQVCGTVNWTSQIKNICEAEGIEATIEFGPGGVLTKLMKRIHAVPARFEVFDLDSLTKVRSSLS